MIDRWLANIFLVAIIGVGGLWAYNESSKAERALCSLRADLEVRAARSEKYLADVDAGRRDPVPGITTADITDSIRNQRRTIDALSILDCPKEAP